LRESSPYFLLHGSNLLLHGLILLLQTSSFMASSSYLKPPPSWPHPPTSNLLLYGFTLLLPTLSTSSLADPSSPNVLLIASNNKGNYKIATTGYSLKQNKMIYR